MLHKSDPRALDRRHRSGQSAGRFLLLIAGLVVLHGSGVHAQGAGADAGRGVYQKANCVGCHKWHGGGGGGYGGAALSLRETGLDRDQIIEVVRCGRPATGMPYHNRDAYKATPCYGMSREELDGDMPPRARSFLREAEVEAVADYVEAAIKGKGPPTHEDCVAYWGADARECQSMKP